MSNLPALARVPSFIVTQKKEMLEIVTDFESKNRYMVQSPDGSLSFDALEVGGSFLGRSFLKSSRPFTIELSDMYGATWMTFRRPWTWIFSELHVHDAGGAPIGSVHQKFKLFGRRFDVTDASGQKVAELHGPMFRPWTFKVMVLDQEVGRIAKKWSGLLREAFTDADNFSVEFGPQMPPHHRAIVLGATFLIDFLYFEKK